MKVTFVKKVLADSMLYHKCSDAEANLLSRGLFGRFDKITIADERDPASAGMRGIRYRLRPSPSWIKET